MVCAHRAATINGTFLDFFCLLSMGAGEQSFQGRVFAESVAVRRLPDTFLITCQRKVVFPGGHWSLGYLAKKGRERDTHKTQH
jgi:hypothetical protein